MTRQQLCETLGLGPSPGRDFTFDAVTEDSRKVRPGSLFIAVQGETADGHAFAPQAATAGAVAILGNRTELAELCGLPYVGCSAPRAAAGIIAHALHGNPSEHLVVIGVTGTNGKSSTVFLIHSILQAAGLRAAKFGTLGYEVAGQASPAPHTTPFAETLAEHFALARGKGMTHVVMEVSSHALDQDRVAGIEFQAAAFTNLTQDHLDYHQDMDTYRHAKLKLFHRLHGPGRFAVVNRDDPSADCFLAASQVPCYTFGKRGDCRATRVRAELRRTTFHMESPWGEAEVAMALLGEHNVSNALCAAAVCGGFGIPVGVVAEGIAAMPCVPGRFEPIDAGQDFQVVVDYAHTDDALRNVLTAARALCNGRVILVFGCGGDRDRGKRPKMGRVAAELATYAVVTSDNPRTEDPLRILLDVEAGIQSANKRKGEDYAVIENRAEAIAHALGMAKTGDLVLIAGKGHEDYQIIGKTKHHFDDREVARKLLEERR